jgi:hypothetical protein
MALKSQPPTPQELIDLKPWAPGSTQAWLPSIVGIMWDRRIPAQDAYDAICAVFPDDEQYDKRCREAARMAKRKYGGRLNTVTVNTGNQWPKPDVAETVATVDRQGAINLESYANSSKNRAGDFATYDILERLFYADALLCVGESFSKAEIRTLKSLRSLDLSRLEFTAPTQATKRVGKNQDGADSVRCLDTIGERRFLVIEFDFAPEKDGKPTI